MKNEKVAILVCKIHWNIHLKISITADYWLDENFKGQQGLMHLIRCSCAFCFHMPVISSISLLPRTGPCELIYVIM